MYQFIVQTVRVSMWCGMASSAMAHSATAVTTPTARGTFFSTTIRQKANFPHDNGVPGLQVRGGDVSLSARGA